MIVTVADRGGPALDLADSLPGYVIEQGGLPVSTGVETEVENGAATLGWPDALVWDDVVIEYARSGRFLRPMRLQLALDDFILLDQLDHAGRCAVRSDRLLQFAKAGAIESPSDTSGALKILLRDPYYRVEHLDGPARFVGPAFWAPPLAAKPPRPSGRAKRIGAIVSYRDHSELTIECLERLGAQRLRSALDVVVVDNQSIPQEREKVDAALARIFGGREDVQTLHPVFDAPFNLSYQNNFAAVLTTADVLLTLNNDCHLIDPNGVQLLADWASTPGVASASPRMVGLGGRLITAGVSVGAHPKTGQPRVVECDHAYLSDVLRGTPAVSTACAAISRAAWFAAGGMDAPAFPTQYDDADLCLRLGRLGYRHLHVGEVSVFHQPGASEARTREIVQGKLARLMDRHPLETIIGRGPDFLPTNKPPAFADPLAAAWTAFAAYSRRVSDARREAPERALEDRPAWATLDALSQVGGEAPEGPITPAVARQRLRQVFKATLEACKERLQETPDDPKNARCQASLQIVEAALTAE